MASTATGEEWYRAKVEELIRQFSPNQKFNTNSGTSQTRPVAAWFDRSRRQTNDLNDVLEWCTDHQARPAVCVIEAINTDWIARIGSSLNIDPSFFATYFGNPEGSDPWVHIFDQYSFDDKPEDGCQARHIDGAFELRYLRDSPNPLANMKAAMAGSTVDRTAWTPRYGYSPSCTTRISYCRVESLYIFLVDPAIPIVAPFVCPPSVVISDIPGQFEVRASLRKDRCRTGLRMAYSTRRGGILFPQLLTHHDHRLFDALCSVFYHGWHLNVLFSAHIGEHTAIGRELLLHHIATSMWRTNLLTLNREIKAVSFRELRRPALSTNVKLHDLREELDDFIEGFAGILAGRSGLAFEHNKMLRANNPDRFDNLTEGKPLKHLEDTMKDARELQKFLMDSFQLLISSVSVAEMEKQAAQSKIAIAQSDRATRLTQLAFIYVPLSFVTSIFGMNISELNGSPLRAWVCVVVLVVVAAGTGAIFGGYEAWKRFRKPKETPHEQATTLAPTSSTTRLIDVEKAQKQA